jgi:hypothetical protein
VGQSSSQHDKCQVGNMHTKILDLVHFHHSIVPPFFHTRISVVLHNFLLLSLYMYCIQTNTIHVLVLVPVPSYLRRWTEEMGCQTHGILMRRVVRHNSLQVRE